SEPYTATTNAVDDITKKVPSKYRPQNIRANAIAPCHVETGFAASHTGMDDFGMEIATRGVNLMTRAGTVDDIANIALFLASEESSFINGVAIAADGGWGAY